VQNEKRGKGQDRQSTSDGREKEVARAERKRREVKEEGTSSSPALPPSLLLPRLAMWTFRRSRKDGQIHRQHDNNNNCNNNNNNNNNTLLDS